MSLVYISAVAAIRLFALLGVLLALPVVTADAQPAGKTPHFEVGGQVTWLRLREFSLVLPRRTETAVGARFTLNLTRQMAIESQLDVYPGDEFFPDRNKLQAVFGVKIGARGRRVGVFGKLRPGLIYVRDPLFCLIPEGCGSAPAGTRMGTRADSWVALDAGVVVEAYPSHWLVARFDIGDTFVRRFDHTDGSGNVFHYSSHNPQVGVGVGIGF
jgi:hypothetical protein